MNIAVAVGNYGASLVAFLLLGFIIFCRLIVLLCEFISLLCFKNRMCLYWLEFFQVLYRATCFIVHPHTHTNTPAWRMYIYLCVYTCICICFSVCNRLFFCLRVDFILVTFFFNYLLNNFFFDNTIFFIAKYIVSS